MTLSVDKIVFDLINAGGLGLGGRSLFTGMIREPDDEPGSVKSVEHLAVFIDASGGPPATILRPYTATSRRTLRENEATITIRSPQLAAPGAYAVGENMSRAVFALVDHVRPSAACSVRPTDGQTQPFFLGIDDDGNHATWTINVVAVGIESFLPVFWGVGLTASSGEAFVLALPVSDGPRSGTAIAVNRLRTIAGAPGVGENLWLSIPTDLARTGSIAFYLAKTDGTPGEALDVVEVETLTVDGVAHTLYRTKRSALGNVTVIVR